MKAYRCGDMGKISIVLHASLRKYSPKPKFDHEIGDPVSIREIVEELGIPDEELGLLAIDDNRSFINSLVHDGQTLKLFPPLGGG
jgi:hypothetical protein